jgi:hypothetical protein
MLTVRPLYCPATGVPSTAQAPRMRGRRHAAAHHFQHVPASTAQSLLPAKGRRGARVTAVISSPFLGVFSVIAAGPGLRRGRVICSGVLAVAAVTAAGLSWSAAAAERVRRCASRARWPASVGAEC